MWRSFILPMLIDQFTIQIKWKCWDWTERKYRPTMPQDNEELANILKDKSPYSQTLHRKVRTSTGYIWSWGLQVFFVSLLTQVGVSAFFVESFMNENKLNDSQNRQLRLGVDVFVHESDLTLLNQLERNGFHAMPAYRLWWCSNNCFSSAPST